MRLAAAALAAMLSLPGAATAAPSRDRVVDTSIAEVAARVARWDGRRVRLRGVIDQCNRWRCHLCPTWNEPDQKRCLRIGEWGDLGAYYSELGDAAYRFSEVTLTATVYDHAAATVCRPTSEATEICELAGSPGKFSSAAPLQMALIERVHVRRAGTSALILGDEDREAITPAPEAERAAMIAALRRDHQMDASEIDNRTDRNLAFLIRWPESYLAYGWICRWKDVFEPVVWPKRQGETAAGVANPYECVRGERTREGWVFPSWRIRRLN